MSTNNTKSKVTVTTGIRKITEERKDSTYHTYYVAKYFDKAEKRRRYKSFNTLEDAIRFREENGLKRKTNDIPKEQRYNRRRIERNISAYNYIRADGTETITYAVTSGIIINGQRTATQYFGSLEDARAYRTLIDNQRKIRNFEKISTIETGNEYPENICRDLKITIDNYPDTYDDIVNAFDKRFSALNIYTDREMRIFNLRYKEYKTLDEIAAEIGVTRERIRQILAKAVRKLMRPVVFNRLIEQETKLEMLNAQETARIRAELKEEMSLDVAMDIVAEKFGFESKEALEEFIHNGGKYGNDKLDMTIDELDLCVREHNCLRRARINTVGELVSLSIDDLMKIRNLGHKSLRGIMEKVHALGLTFKEEIKGEQ